MSFSSTVSLAGVSLGPTSSLDSDDQQALKIATAESLHVPPSAVTYKGVAPATSTGTTVAAASATHTSSTTTNNLNSKTDPHRQLAAELDVLLAMRVTLAAGQSPGTLYANLTAALSSAVTSGAFTASLVSAAAQVKSAALLTATVADVSSGNFTVDTVAAQTKPNSGSAKNHSLYPVGLITGIVAGVSILGVLLLYWNWRRQKQRKQRSVYIESSDPDSQIEIKAAY